MTEANKTLSFFDQGSSTHAKPAPAPCLTIAIDGHQLLAPATRFSLADVQNVQLGRGQERRVTRDGTTLSIELPDGWMSSTHARLEQTATGWRIHDSSKNGTFVGGERLTNPRNVHDGAVIAVGNTVAVFCDTRSPAVDLEVSPTDMDGLTTLSPTLEQRFSRLRSVIPASVSILITGETGTGKEVLARAIHDQSRRPGQFVALNCGAIPEHLIESQLFGHKKGAFSGAVSDHKGWIQTADRGTLFLDEIAELPSHLQVKLLRVLQENVVVPVGTTTPIRVDLRVVAATLQDLEAAIKAGRFREDLYERLAGHALKLPPLRARMQDLGLLIGTLLRRIAGDQAGQVHIDRAALAALFAYRWPGNIRRLENTLRTAWQIAGVSPIAIEHLPDELQQPGPDQTAPDDDPLAVELRTLLAEHNGHVPTVAKAMGKHRSQVHRWCKRLGIDPDTFK